MSKILVTGSSGLIGSEVVDYFCKLGWEVHGVDNNMRADFLAPGETPAGTKNACRLCTRNFAIMNWIFATGQGWTL